MSSLKKIIIVAILSVISVCPIFVSDSLAVTDNFQVQQTVTACNNNGSCETGETNANCPNDCAAETPASVPGGGFKEVTLPNVRDLEVHPTYNSVFISWSATKPSYAVLKWGKTEECELGSIGGLEISSEYDVFLDNLEPDTYYYFLIELRDEDGNENAIYPHKFKTFAEPDINSPANVDGLTITRLGESNDAVLSWVNSPDEDFAGVRIVRSDKFFPADIYDGTTVYEGDGQSVIDKEIEQDVTYYYSVFTYDFSGNYSSGAISTFTITKGQAVIPPFVIPVVPPEEVPPEVSKMDLSFFDFFQNNLKLSVIDGRVIVDAEKPLEILLSYEKSPEVLKTILVTLIEPSEEKRQFAFLLKVNKDKTRYEAKIAPLKTPGLYEVSIAVLDYKNQALKKFKTFLMVEAIQAAVVDTSEKGGWEEKIFHESGSLFWWFLFLALIVLAVWIMFGRQLKSKK